MCGPGAGGKGQSARKIKKGKKTKDGPRENKKRKKKMGRLTWPKKPFFFYEYVPIGLINANAPNVYIPYNLMKIFLFRG